MQFEVHPFPSELQQLFKYIDSHTEVPCNSCVMVGYLGKAFCAACALGQCGSSKKCSTILHYHQDRGGAANSQADSDNVTISVGDPRVLSMQLRVRHTDGSEVSPPGAPDFEFALTSGSMFKLAKHDEDTLPRSSADGQVCMGSYFHGMVTPLEDNGMAAGFVSRHVTKVRDVNVHTNCVIPTWDEYQKYTQEVPRQKVWGFPSRAAGFKSARAEWQSHACEYACVMRPLVEAALERWDLSS